MSTPRTSEPFTARWIGRCPSKGCAVCLHVDVPMIRERWTQTLWNHSALPAFSFEEHQSRVYSAINGPSWGPSWLDLHCMTHKREIRWTPVNGSYSEEHVCDARCMNAKGPNCDCSCGGANHGRGYHVELKFKI